MAANLPPGWTLPDDERLLCADETYPIPLGNVVSDDQLLVRLVVHDAEFVLVEFALVQQTLHLGAWCEVAEIDSKHGFVHKHQNVCSTGMRVGEREWLMDLHERADVQLGYNVAYPAMMRDWEGNRERWHRG